MIGVTFPTLSRLDVIHEELLLHLRIVSLRVTGSTKDQE